MVGIVREGARLLLIETNYLDELKEYFSNSFKVMECSFELAFENAGENSTVIVLSDNKSKNTNKNDLKDSLIIKEEPDTILTKIIKEGKAEIIQNIDIPYKTIFLRVMGNLEKVFDEIKNDYEAVEVQFMDIQKDNVQGVILYLTEKPLNRIIKLNDIYKQKGLYINENYYDLFRELRVHGLKYINAGMENNDWYELEIKIYDQYGAYKKHFERLVMILEALEVGIILGHFWAKDYPRVMLSVDVYSVRFFTLFEPKEIKRILLGLEHLADGTRVVDYDLFYKKEKVYWRELVNDKKESRQVVSKKYRNEILSKLTTEEREENLLMEEEIMLSRK